MAPNLLYYEREREREREREKQGGLVALLVMFVEAATSINRRQEMKTSERGETKNDEF